MEYHYTLDFATWVGWITCTFGFLNYFAEVIGYLERKKSGKKCESDYLAVYVSKIRAIGGNSLSVQPFD